MVFLLKMKENLGMYNKIGEKEEDKIEIKDIYLKKERLKENKRTDTSWE